MGRGCGQRERSLGAITSFLPFPSLISNQKQKMPPGQQTRATVFHGGRAARDQAEESDLKLSLRLCFCFPCVKDAHEATRRQIRADPNPTGAEVTSHMHLASSVSPRWGRAGHAAIANPSVPFPPGSAAETGLPGEAPDAAAPLMLSTSKM